MIKFRYNSWYSISDCIPGVIRLKLSDVSPRYSFNIPSSKIWTIDAIRDEGYIHLTDQGTNMSLVLKDMQC